MQMSLRTRVTKDCCIFGDVMDVYAAGGRAAYDYIASREDYSCKLETAAWLPTKSHGWCLQHERECPFSTGSSIRVGGFPCQDFPAAGRKQGLDGPNLPYILGFGRKVQDAGNSLLCIENVPSCPRDLVSDAFGPGYTWIAEDVFSPADVGFSCINRPRPV